MRHSNRHGQHAGAGAVGKAGRIVSGCQALNSSKPQAGSESQSPGEGECVSTERLWLAPVCLQNALHARHLGVACVAVERKAVAGGVRGRQAGAKAPGWEALVRVVVLQHQAHR